MKTVKERVEQYKNDKDFNLRKEWIEKKVTPVLEKIIIEQILYENIITELQGCKYINEIKSFYDSCLMYNKWLILVFQRLTKVDGCYFPIQYLKVLVFTIVAKDWATNSHQNGLNINKYWTNIDKIFKICLLLNIILLNCF